MSLEPDRCVALGDSFSAGLSDGSVPWRELTARGLQARGEPVELHNLARVNATTAEVTEHQLEPGLALSPRLVSLVCGANDVLLAVRPDPDAFEAAFEALLAFTPPRSATGVSPPSCSTRSHRIAPNGWRARERHVPNPLSISIAHARPGSPDTLV